MVQRTFLVTGASKGIGLAISKRLAAAGHHVIGIARQALPSFPGTLASVDLNDDKASAEAFVELAQCYSFDGVVNNSGVGKLQRLGEVDLEVVNQLLHFNLHSPINAVQAILPTLRQKGWGRILNITSVVILGMVNRTAYAASKAALGSFTRTWALELAETGITVNSVAPSQAIFLPSQKTSYDGVRTFGGFILHVAQANYIMAARLSGLQPDVDVKSLAGLKTKDVAASFAFLHNAISTLTIDNAFQSVGSTSRVVAAAASLAHTSDEYGQMVEYLRMNGLTPPSSGAPVHRRNRSVSKALFKGGATRCTT